MDTDRYLRRRLLRLAALACLPFLALDAAAAQTQPAGEAPRGRDIYAELQPLKNDLQRYQHLVDAMPRLERDERIVPLQLLAAVEDQLGLYNEAIRDFPFDNRVRFAGELPQPAQWQASDAVEVIAKLAAGRRIVMINEAHHDAHTRALTLALLPRLRAEGFTHFAAEALHDADPGLAQRGYPIPASGSQYLREPLYGEIVRQALKLGFVVVPYESDAPTIAEREAGQARQLYRKVFQADPKARLFIHAGYAHIDKAPGNLGAGVKPMAMQLRELTGLDPLSIDQTRWRDISVALDDDPYRQLVALYQPQKAVVLTHRDDGHAWTADPTRHDVDVLLPGPGRLRRPRWLALDGRRMTRLITTDLCAGRIPCVVEAQYADESDEAIPADRFTFLAPEGMSSLYLSPGRYRLRAWGADGRTLLERRLEVSP
jgi:hypothetical protein